MMICGSYIRYIYKINIYLSQQRMSGINKLVFKQTYFSQKIVYRLIKNRHQILIQIWPEKLYELEQRCLHFKQIPLNYEKKYSLLNDSETL